MTRCILFDFGNVIAFFDHMIACRRLASWSRPALDAQDVYRRVFNGTKYTNNSDVYVEIIGATTTGGGANQGQQIRKDVPYLIE